MTENKWPIRYKWRWAYTFALLLLAGVELAAVILALIDGDWSRTLTHQTIALAWRWPYWGLVGTAFLGWLLAHFVIRFWKVRRGR
jgi:hypothetical protein